jgi:polar amino acid transport system permease protein
MSDLWDWQFTFQILPILARASLVTIEATLLGFVLAAILGLLLALMRMSRSPWVAWPAHGFVEFIRSTPLLVELFFMFFVLPKFGVQMGPLTTGILTLGLHYSTFCAEVYRSGLDNIPKGQWEAAIALNLSPYVTFRDIIIPQAIPPIIPALGNYLVGLFKETPQLAGIAVTELMLTAQEIGSENFRYTEPITLVGVFFLVLSLISAAGIRRTEAWLNERIKR